MNFSDNFLFPIKILHFFAVEISPKRKFKPKMATIEENLSQNFHFEEQYKGNNDNSGFVRTFKDVRTFSLFGKIDS